MTSAENPVTDSNSPDQGGQSLTKWAALSVAAAVATLALKFGAYGATGSVGLLSDAVESSVNLVAAFTSLFALWYANRPVDRTHNYGHEKIEFFASAIEGGLILFAAFGILYYSVQRLIEPRAIEDIGLGIVVSIIASAINFAVATVLMRKAIKHDSIVLEADSHHLMTDVWSSAGVVLALIGVRLTGWERLDPIIGILIAINIVWTGFKLLRASFNGLMDRALPRTEQEEIRSAIEQELGSAHAYHALRTRRAGTKRFADLHLLVPGGTTVRDSHEIANRVEYAVDQAISGTDTTVHIEPLEDPVAWSDSEMIGVEPPPGVDHRDSETF